MAVQVLRPSLLDPKIYVFDHQVLLLEKNGAMDFFKKMFHYLDIFFNSLTPLLPEPCFVLLTWRLGFHISLRVSLPLLNTAVFEGGEEEYF